MKNKMNIKTEDMKQSISQIEKTIENSNKKDCKDIICAIDNILKNINSNQKNMVRQLKKVSSNV